MSQARGISRTQSMCSRRTALRVVLAIAAAGFHAACTQARPHSAPSGTAADSAAVAASSAGSISVDVENHSSYDVIIFAVRGTLRRRIGSVAGVSRTRLAVPASFVADRAPFSVAAVRLAGQESFVSDPVSPQEGIHLVLTLQSRLVNSALAVQ